MWHISINIALLKGHTSSICFEYFLSFGLHRIGISVASHATYAIDTWIQPRLMMDQMEKYTARHAMQPNLESEGMDLDRDQERRHL